MEQPVPDDNDQLCLCIANGLPPTAHKRGERCPNLDILLYGNAYGIRQADGTVKWLDPATIVIIRDSDTGPVTGFREVFRDVCTCGHKRDEHGHATVDTQDSCFMCGCWGFEAGS